MDGCIARQCVSLAWNGPGVCVACGLTLCGWMAACQSWEHKHKSLRRCVVSTMSVGLSSRQCLLGCCLNNVCWACASSHVRDLLCCDQGLIPSPGPSPIDPHHRRGPRSIGLHCTSSARQTSHLFGASDITSHLFGASYRSLAGQIMGLINQINIVAINLHLWLQSGLVSFCSLTHFTGLVNKLLHSKRVRFDCNP